MSTVAALKEVARQYVLHALACLAVAKPDLDATLNWVALKMDRSVGGRAMLFEVLKSVKQRYLVPDIAHKALILDSTVLTALMKGRFLVKKPVGRK